MSFAAHDREDRLQALSQVEVGKVEQATSCLQAARDADRHIFTCGNGGSASTASHFVCDIVKGASYGRKQRFRILALNDSLATITAYSNDVGYGCVFAETAEELCCSGRCPAGD